MNENFPKNVICQNVKSTLENMFKQQLVINFKLLVLFLEILCEQYYEISTKYVTQVMKNDLIVTM